MTQAATGATSTMTVSMALKAIVVSSSTTSKVVSPIDCSTTEEDETTKDDSINAFNGVFGSSDDFDNVDDERKARIFGGFVYKKKNLWRGVSIRNKEEKERINEENVEGLVCKSKGFLSMNL